MRIYNVLGYAALGLQLVLSAWLAPHALGPWWGMAIGFGYLRGVLVSRRASICPT